MVNTALFPLKYVLFFEVALVEWVVLVEQTVANGDFANKIIFNDEAHWHISRITNEQKRRI